MIILFANINNDTRHFSMFEEAKKRDTEVGYPPRGVPVTKFLLDERTRILKDIFILVC